MIAKTKIIELLDKLPDTVDIDMLIERLVFMEKVEKGLADVEAGKTFTTEEAKILLSKWQK